MIERSDLKIIDLQINDVNGGVLQSPRLGSKPRIREAKKEIQRVLQAEERGGLEGAEPLRQIQR